MLFSIAAAQLCQDADLATGYNPKARARRNQVTLFLTQFRDKWEPSRNLWGTSERGWTSSPQLNSSSWKDLVFQYHMRVFTTPHPGNRLAWPAPGLKRESGTIPGEKNTPLDIYEIRYSVGLKTTWALDFPVFSIVTMADAAAGSLKSGLPNLQDRHDWEEAGMRPSVRATGVAAFAFRIQSLLPQWEAHWSRLLDDIGRLATGSANVSNPSKPFRRQPFSC